MVEYGLTGGIGSGKSTVAAGLVTKGAGLVDADATAKLLQRRGTPVFQAIVDRFGPDIVAPDGELDRPALAAIVFADPEELKALNGIVHPAVHESMRSQRADLVDSHSVVILDIPLLVEGGSAYSDLGGVIVVDVPIEVAVQRLVDFRGFEEADARSRIENQAGRDERLARADFVIDNSGTLDDLAVEIDRCWAWINRSNGC